MNRKKTTALAGLAALLVGGLAFAKKKDEDDEEDIIIPANVVNIDPVGPGGVEPEKPPPPPPVGGVKNYVGSGYNWPRKDRFPTEASFAAVLNSLGYNTSIVESIISARNMTAARQFQRDFNDVLVTVPTPPMSKLSEDGLIGKNTIAALLVVLDAWVPTLQKPWASIVAEAKANA